MLQAVRMLTELARPSEDRERANARAMDGATSSTDIDGKKKSKSKSEIVLQRDVIFRSLFLRLEKNL